MLLHTEMRASLWEYESLMLYQTVLTHWFFIRKQISIHWDFSDHLHLIHDKLFIAICIQFFHQNYLIHIQQTKSIVSIQLEFSLLVLMEPPPAPGGGNDQHTEPNQTSEEDRNFCCSAKPFMHYCGSMFREKDNKNIVKLLLEWIILTCWLVSIFIKILKSSSAQSPIKERSRGKSLSPRRGQSSPQRRFTPRRDKSWVRLFAAQGARCLVSSFPSS